MYIPAATLNNDDLLFVAAGEMYGDGWWGDRWKDVKKAAKTVQKSQAVRDLEKGVVTVGAKALRGAAETGLDAAADSALTAVGAPELAPMADKLIHKGANYLQTRGVKALDDAIDKSGKGRRVRYIMPSGGGMRLAGGPTRLGSGMRLAGHQGQGMRLAGHGQMMSGGVVGNGMRLAGGHFYNMKGNPSMKGRHRHKHKANPEKTRPYALKGDGCGCD